MRRMIGLVAAGLVAAVSVSTARGAEAAGAFADLGPQITATTLLGTTFTKDAGGRELLCTVMRGQPAKLVVYDLKSGEMLKVLPLAGAEGGWNAATASDGSVYVGTDANGHLYRWVPGAEQVEDLGRVGPGQTWAWDVAAGKDGEVFVGTYDGGRVIRYRPGEGFREVSDGPVSAGEQYVRAVAYDPATGKVYAGVGSHAHLVELDPKTGEKVEMLPAEYADQEFVYGVNVFGDHLFAYVTNLGKSVVINLKTRKVEAVLPAMTGQQVMVKSPVDERVYYAANGRLWAYDMARPGEGPAELVPCGNALGMTWEQGAGGPVLVVFMSDARVLRYDVGTGKASVRAMKKPVEPVEIQSIALGPDGRIWMGGYLSGGNAAYDPGSGRSEEYKGLSQSESIASLGESLYFGLYPHGRFAAYDVTRAWGKRGNPEQLGKIEGQSRPFAGMGVPGLKKVFFGIVPEYGKLGGGIAAYDLGGKKLEFFHNVVKDQSVIALAYVDGLVVGGTSVSGGLGVEPTEKEGRVFLWDPKRGEKVFETVPVSGEPAVTCVIDGPDGRVWGVAGGTVFVFEPHARKVVSRHKLFDVNYAGKHVWRGATMVVHPDGFLYGTLEGRLFRLDPKTMHVTVLRDRGAGLLAMDRQGRLYFRDGIHLWRYTPSADRP